FDNISATDLSVNYEFPIQKVTFFAQAKMINTFNNQAQINGDITVRTARNASCIKTIGANIGKRCATFNPFTDTPVEGINWVKAATFGKPRTPTTSGGVSLLAANGDFQLPRTYLFSFGGRF
ncbi:MAG TPA: hypothetical protein VEZ11_00260, partial [Thermoanaerobaculia bacterium]|nr:hypothetical protein [Thermoanaerobaculia bacterium]